MKYRVKQINESTFIPQCKSWYDFEWGNIDKDDNYVWSSSKQNWSICHSLDSALQVIMVHKTIKREKKQYPKYHKV